MIRYTQNEVAFVRWHSLKSVWCFGLSDERVQAWSSHKRQLWNDSRLSSLAQNAQLH